MNVFKLTFVDVDGQTLWVEVEAESAQEAESQFKKFDGRCSRILKVEPVRLEDLQKAEVLLPSRKRPSVEKHRTNDKCDVCGSANLRFRRYGMIDNEGYIHSGFPDWYRCLDCGSWVLAYPSNDSGRI